MGLFENSHFPYTNFHEMNMDKLVEICEGSAGQAQALASRMTAAEDDIDILETRANATDGQISTINSNINTINGDIDALETRATTSEGDITGLTSRMTTAEGDIDALETRITTDEATIATQATQIAGKSTVDVTQILDAGVNVANIEIDGTTTRIYAPTAGSTYVRAMDVPFNNEHTTLPGSTVQDAIEELNGDINSIPLMYGRTIYPSETIYISTEGTVFSGYIYGGSKNIAFTIPWTAAFDGRYSTPIQSPQNFTATLQGNLYVRGITGMLLNNINVAASDISGVTITPAACGTMIVITLANALSVTNNTPLTVTMTNGAYLRFNKIP